MSINLKSAIDETGNVQEVMLTSFRGITPGRCLQLNQGIVPGDRSPASIQMTEDQVRQTVEVMQAWLNGEYIER